MPPEGTAGEDTRVWLGRISSGHEAEHDQFVNWLNSPEAAEIFRRRRLTEYQLFQHNGEIRIVFKTPHTGDPRIIIDFLRYPGLWPDYWEFLSSGDSVESADTEVVRVHWKRHAQS